MPGIRLKTLAIIVAAVGIPVIIWVMAVRISQRDERALRRIVNTMANAAGAMDADRMVRGIAPDYNHQGLNRDDLRRTADAFFEEFGASSVTITSFNASVSGNIATANASFMVHNPRFEREGLRMLTARWQFNFSRRDGEWIITAMDPVSIGRRDFEDWGQIIQRLGVSPGGQ